MFLFFTVLTGVLLLDASMVLAQTVTPRPGTCQFFCGNTPQSSIPFHARQSDGTDATLGSSSEDCLDVCRRRCADVCDGSTGGCYAVKCAYQSAPTTRTSGPSFTRSTAQCAGNYVISNRTNPTELDKAYGVISRSTSYPTLNELNCRTSVAGTDRDSNCINAAGICSGSQLCCLGEAPAASNSNVNCLERALAAQASLSDAQKTTLRNQLTNNGTRQLSCQRICSATTRNDQTKCISGGCDGEATACCIPAIGPAATTQNANLCRTTVSNTTAASTPRRLAGDFGLTLPACISDGNCQLSDILATGVNFANFLFGLAGALFFALIVYGGFRYVFFAYDSGTAAKSKEMIKTAMIGLLLMMLASLFIRFVSDAVRGADVSGETCTSRNGPSYSCVDIHPTGSLNTARSQAQTRGCIPNQCPGTGGNIMCCPAGWDAVGGSSTP